VEKRIEESKDRWMGRTNADPPENPPMERTSRVLGGPPSSFPQDPFHPVTQSVKGPHFSVVSYGSKPSVDKTKKDNPSRKKKIFKQPFWKEPFVEKRIEGSIDGRTNADPPEVHPMEKLPGW
jgi:hypothetical protein